MSIGTGFDPSKRIPRNLRENDTFHGVSVNDGAIIVLPAVLAFLIGQHLPSLLPYLAYVVGLVSSVLIWYLAPEHLGAYEWTEGIVHHLIHPKQLDHITHQPDMARENTELPPDSIFGTSTRTQDITNVKRIHKNAHAVEREDGTMVAAIEVEPANMALASEQRWNQMVNQWESFLNNTLTYPVQIYGTTSTFPVDNYINDYRQRVNSPDLENAPILKAVLQSFISWYPEYLRWQGTHQRNYYIIVTVDPDEIYHADTEEDGIMQQLADVPGLGPLLSPFVNTGSGYTEADREREQLKILAQRCKEVENQGIRPLKGCQSRRLTGTEFAILLKEYWEGRELDFDKDSIMQTLGTVMPGDEPVTPDEVASDNGYESDVEQETN